MFRNMKISKKLILTFVIVEIISSIAGIVGFIVMTHMDSNYSKALTDYGFSQGDIGLFNTEFNNNLTIIRDVIITSDTQAIKAYSDQLSASDTKIDNYFANMKKGMLNEKEMSYYNNIKENLEKFTKIKQQIVSLGLSNNDLVAQAILTGQGTPISENIRNDTNSLISEKTMTGKKIADSLSAEGTNASISILMIILLSFSVSLIIAFSISHGISKPVKEMADAAQKMAQGDLSVQVSVKSRDEIGRLCSAFAQTIATLKAYINEISVNLTKVSQGDLNVDSQEEYKGDFEALKNSIDGIVVSFNEALTQINDTSEQVSSGSNQVSDGAQGLAQGASEQASSVEELSATIAEISEHIKSNAENASHATVNVNHVSAEIEVSNRHMSDMLTAMSEINHSSSQIRKIIKIIEDIAFQTNILALNAAVEAAKAGAAGKGFAVVADEVRNLASKSAEAAKDTSRLIENSIRQVENGIKVANETSSSLFQVVEGSKAVADMVEKISQASNQQSDAIRQVTLGVEQISGVIQMNSATAQESAAASKELSEQAQEMRRLVEKFKLREEISQETEE